MLCTGPLHRHVVTRPAFTLPEPATPPRRPPTPTPQHAQSQPPPPPPITSSSPDNNAIPTTNHDTNPVASWTVPLPEPPPARPPHRQYRHQDRRLRRHSAPCRSIARSVTHPLAARIQHTGSEGVECVREKTSGTTLFRSVRYARGHGAQTVPVPEVLEVRDDVLNP